MRAAALLGLLGALLCGVPRPAASGVVESSPVEKVRQAVSLIDRDYWRAKTNPAWQQAKQALLAGRYGSTGQAYAALAEGLDRADDPGLYLVSAEEFRAREDVLEARRTGTGLPAFAIDWDRASGGVRVVTALGDSPAARAGIRPQDIIVSIDGQATRAMSHPQVAEALGAQGRVRLVIERGGRLRRVTLTPSKEPVDAVQFSRRKMGGKTIGYIRVLLFTPGAGDRVRYAVTALEGNGVDGYVLDLRNNPGGLLSSAEQAASAFTTGVLGTEVRGQKGPGSPLVTYGAPLTGKPLFVLVNGGTASAAELLASGLRDLHRAVLVGTPTFGSGQTQRYVPLSDGYGVMVPTAEIRTPDGQALQAAGIRPDLEVSGDFVSTRVAGTPRDAQFRQAVAVLAHSSKPPSTP